MQIVKLAILAAAIAAAAGCGGRQDSTGDGSGTAYDFVPPKLGSTRSYSETIVDNSNNTINIGYADETTAVQSDGSYSQLSMSSTGNSTIVNGTNYATPTENQNYDAMGRETSYNYTASGDMPVSCTFAPHGSGPNYLVMVGETCNYQLARRGRLVLGQAVDFDRLCWSAADQRIRGESGAGSGAHDLRSVFSIRPTVLPGDSEAPEGGAHPGCRSVAPSKLDRVAGAHG
jgi:hypothetical protein